MRTVPSVLVMLTSYALVWVGVFVARAQAPREVGPGECEGFGFGCVLTPYDGWSLVMVLVLAPLTVGAVLLSSGWLVARRRRPAHPVARGLSSVAFGVTGALLIAFVGTGITSLDG